MVIARGVSLAISIACLCMLVPSAQAQGRKPEIVSYSVVPHSLPAGGGVITLTGRVRYAASCTINVCGITRETVHCASGH